jgi:hypothetical protein
MLGGNLRQQKVSEMLSEQCLKSFQVVVVIERADKMTLVIFFPGVEKLFEQVPLPKEFLSLLRRV